MSREEIVREILQERGVQAKLHPPSEDDAHDRDRWVAIITRQIGLAVNSRDDSPDVARWRRQMVRVAALAISALEAFERQREPWRGILNIGQQLAEQHNQPILVMKQEEPRREGSTSSVPYLVISERATKWEKANAIHTVYPASFCSGFSSGG